MGLFGHSKKHEKAGSEEAKIKTPEETPPQNELDQIKNEVRDVLATISTAAHQLEEVKVEYGLELKKLTESKKELESNKIEISK